ncbi:hypothetical protein E0485_00215 [Paenibacillus albiflavus]|uniref:Nuclear transport factor 2 family protein n=1 Tax=Paenibacillus albiflavus TaxID=2545760 RepID=A0A4R4ELU4_9BACL|nr:hypothetical protein [Paenibacillus albiflavus]TCZ80757.1 hypothetical protein E0485_00215 [Paenibacillus albiflavus]
MIQITDELLSSFTKMHDKFISDWHEAMNTGDTSSLEVMTNEYYVAFFNDAKDKPMMFNRDESISGMNESVNQLLGGKKVFNDRVIRLKDKENAAVFYDLSIEFKAKTVARFFTIENWQLVDEKWLIVSEIQQRII